MTKENCQQSFGVVGETRYGLQGYVPTPGWVVDALVASKHPPPRDVLDPFAGDGAILRRLAEHGWDRRRLHAVELRESEKSGLLQQGFGSLRIGDFFETPAKALFGHCGVVTNVPWKILVRAVTDVLSLGLSYAASLQPVEELAGIERCDWLNDHPPTGLVLLKRRPFKKAARGCAWFIWEEGKPPIDLDVR